MFIELIACASVLRVWKENPATKRRDYRCWHGWDQGPEADEPLSLSYVAAQKEFLRLHAPSSFSSLFPKEARVIFPCDQMEGVIRDLLNKQPFRPFWILTTIEHALEIDQPELVVMLTKGLKVLQRYVHPDKPVMERTIWVGFAHIRHIEWHDLQSVPVIEFATQVGKADGDKVGIIAK